jgi:HEAT repeat protein
MRRAGSQRAGWARTAAWAGWLLLAPAVAFAQVPFEQAIGGLSSNDPKIRLRSATLLKESAYLESAIPLAKLISDPDNAVQLEAIAAEVNIFTRKGGPRRVGIITIEDRTGAAAAQRVFDMGPLAVGTAAVPPPVLLTLRLATRDDSAKVCLESLYAFGTLASQATGKARRDLLEASLSDVISMLSLPDPALRVAAVRVIGRLYARRPGDGTIEPRLGDAVINAVNEENRDVKLAAMDTLGALRDARATDGLTQLFQFFGRSDMGLAALVALARVGDKSSVPLFLTQLSGKTPPPFKVAAIEGLARAGDASHIPAIQDALNRERDDRVFDAGVFAAAMLINGSIERLVDSLNRPKAHDAARQYLVELVPGRVARLARYAQDPAPRMRIDIADIVGLAGDPQGRAVVMPLLTDMDPDVVFAAQRAMARLNTDR